MKYWRGYLTAAIFAVLTWGLREFAKGHSVLVDMIYPYVTRMAQSFLTDWSSGVEFCLWQMLLLVMLLLVIATVVLMVILKWNPIQWFGWVCAAGAVVVFLNFGVFGLNDFAGPLSEDVRLHETDYTITELENAAAYYRDQANALADKVRRDENGNVVYADFETLAARAGDGFYSLVYDQSLSVFAGSMTPVKKLGLADQFAAWGVTGITVPITGEAAVNPNIPAVILPFAMCQEMARRMSITIEKDTSFAAYLACRANSDVQFRYSGMLMSYRACLLALQELDLVTGSGAFWRVTADEHEKVTHDLKQCNDFFGKRQQKDAQVCDLLTSWHIQEIVIPSLLVEEDLFDPMDKNQVDLSDHPNA